VSQLFVFYLVGLSAGSRFDPTKLKHAMVVISRLLAAHGHQFAAVKPSYEINPSSNTVTLVFNIDEESFLRTRIGDAGPATQVSGFPTYQS